MATVTSKTKEEHDQKEMARKGLVKVSTDKPVGYRIADVGPGGKESNVKTDEAWDNHVVGQMPRKSSDKTALSIGKGRYVDRHGMDSNGNHYIHVAQGSNKPVKIQTNQNLPTVHSTKPELTHKGVEEIHAYMDSMKK